MKTLLAATAALATVLAVAPAQALDIQAFDNGWYERYDGGPGYHDPANTNTYTSNSGIHEFRSFYAFDLTGAAAASAISITFYGGNGTYYSPDPSETVDLYDYTGSVGDLVDAGGDQTATFNDLGAGVKLGSATAYPDVYPLMPMFTVSLSSAFVAQYNAALAGSDKRIALGAALATGSPFGEALWSSSGFSPAAYLTVSGAVPEPASWALTIAGFGLAGAALRRRRAATA